MKIVVIIVALILVSVAADAFAESSGIGSLIKENNEMAYDVGFVRGFLTAMFVSIAAFITGLMISCYYIKKKWR